MNKIDCSSFVTDLLMTGIVELNSGSLSRFDRLVFGVIGVVAAVISVVLWHGLVFVKGPTVDDISLVVYLVPDQFDVTQLAAISAADGAEPQMLTDHETDVKDFTVSPDGQTIVYSLRNFDGTSDLWQVNTNGRNAQMLLDCPEAECKGASWAPMPDRLIYEQRILPAPNTSPGPPRLWWFDLNNGSTVPVSADTQWRGWGAQFSPDGEWLSFVVPLLQEVQAYNFATGESIAIESRTGEPPFWSPAGYLYYTDVQLRGEEFSVHIFRAELATQEVFDVSGEDAVVNDGAAVWSPDGTLIAFNRKPARTPAGKQLWIMNPDGSEARSLTQIPDLHHGPPQWSADGSQLVYQTFNLTELNGEPQIWVIDVASGDTVFLANGSQPKWVFR